MTVGAHHQQVRLGGLGVFDNGLAWVAFALDVFDLDVVGVEILGIAARAGEESLRSVLFETG